MTLASRLATRLLGLPPARNRVSVEHDLRIPMPDGAVLLADHYSPVGVGSRPTILVRSPYGRAGIWGVLGGRLLAERGYHVVVQSCRGTFRSGGEFYAVRNESSDGRATIEWLASQPWFDGRLGTTGGSYLGFTQWAIAADPPVPIRAMCIQVSASNTRERVFRGGSFSLADSLGWIRLIANQEKPPLAAIASFLTTDRDLKPLWKRLPLADLDKLATGRAVPFYQDWLMHHDPGDKFWEAIDFQRELDASTAQFHLVGGWYDIFLPDTIADYLELRRLGRRPRLVIGPWTHVQGAVNGVVVRETLEWMDRTLANGAVEDSRRRVHLQLGGSREWIDFDEWPPPAEVTPWRLGPNHGLSVQVPPTSDPDHYRFDPADPTPAVGGALLSPRMAGPKDNRGLEARSDVVVYTSEPLSQHLYVVGPLAADVYFRSSLSSTDLFVRLCDVDERGKSINVSDGLIRLQALSQSDVSRARVEMWPIGYRFGRGHRLRLQVSSGAHPRFARNLGTDEPLSSATSLRAAELEIFHDPERQSAILLPVLPTGSEN